MHLPHYYVNLCLFHGRIYSIIEYRCIEYWSFF